MRRNKSITCLILLVLSNFNVIASDNSSIRIAPPLNTFSKKVYPTELEKNSGAIVLKKIVKITSDGKGGIEKNIYVAVKILNKSAADDYSQIAIRFNHFYTVMKLDFARLVNAGGKVYEVNSDAWKIEDVPGFQTFSEDKRVTFSLPAVSANSVIEYQVSSKSLNKPMNNNWMQQRLFHHMHYSNVKSTTRVEHTRRSEIQIESPKSEYIKYRLRNNDTRPEVEDLGGGVIRRTWSLNKLSGFSIENGMPTFDELIPILDITTVKSWTEVDEWAYGIYGPASIPNSSIISQAKKITLNKKNNKEKIKAIYKYVQENIRYVAAYIDRGGYVPHEAGDVFVNKYGDCKDQAILVISLLRAVGIEAMPVLMRLYPEVRINKEIPTKDFSHMIVYVPGEKIWLDTSGAEAQFPAIDWTMENRLAFIIDGKGGKLKSIPSSNAGDNVVSFSGNYYFRKNDVVLDFVYDFSGVIGNRWRTFLNSLSDAKEMLRKTFLDRYASAELEEFKYSSHKNVESKLTFKGKVVFKGKSVSVEDFTFYENAFPALFVAASINDVLNTQDRRFDYNYGFDFIFKFEEVFHSPSKFHKAVILKEPLEYRSKWLTVNNLSRVDGSKVSISTTIKYKNKRVNADEFQDYIDVIKNASTNNQWSINYIYDKLISNKSNAVNRIETGDNKSLLNMVEQYMDSGDYDKAIKLIRKIIVRDKGNGYAYYLLGISYGFVDKYDESERALLKSSKLGYKP